MPADSGNPYADHPQLSHLEQDVLWEYAKLGDKLKRIAGVAEMTAAAPNEALLTELRFLEQKMGLVLTLFKASVWSVISEAAEAQEDEQQRQTPSATTPFWEKHRSYEET